MKHLSIIALASVTVLGAAAAPALGATTRAATSSELAAMASAIHANPVGLGNTPQASYRLAKGVVYTSCQRWAKVNLVPTASAKGTFQASRAVMVRSAGTTTWSVMDVGTDRVDCSVVPPIVGTALNLTSEAGTCGVGAPPATLANPTVTGWQLMKRFFNYLEPSNAAKLKAFIAPSYFIRRFNGTDLNKTAYLVNHPTFSNAGVLVNSAEYSNGQITVASMNWQTTVPGAYLPSLSTFVWVNGIWQITSFARFAPVAELPASS